MRLVQLFNIHEKVMQVYRLLDEHNNKSSKNSAETDRVLNSLTRRLQTVICDYEFALQWVTTINKHRQEKGQSIINVAYSNKTIDRYRKIYDTDTQAKIRKLSEQIKFNRLSEYV